MIVDDNVDAAKSLAMPLQASGYEARTCFDAQDALRESRALPEHADAALVVLTGYGQTQEYEGSRQAGFDHRMVKPARVAEILALLGALAAPE